MIVYTYIMVIIREAESKDSQDGRDGRRQDFFSIRLPTKPNGMPLDLDPRPPSKQGEDHFVDITKVPGYKAPQ